MAPNSTTTTVLSEARDPPITALYDKHKVTPQKPVQPIIWTSVFFIGLFHVIALGATFYCWRSNKFLTAVWGFFIGGVGGFGVTAGAHRLWAHRSYKAKWPLRLILLICFSVSGQNSMYNWVRDHRVHHKFSETDADPHNSKRGFFFAHVGWLMCRKHPQVIEKGRKIDMSDVMADPLVKFHEKYFEWFKLIFCFIIPTYVPYRFFDETLLNSILMLSFMRYIYALNFTWLVNSAAHIWGNKPFDTRISPAENRVVSALAMGEGWHNYHHVFPWDYKAAELGNYSLNVTTMWIDLFAKIGWAYDRKQPSAELVQNTALRHGDGTHVSEVSPPDENQNSDVTNMNLMSDKMKST